MKKKTILWMSVLLALFMVPATAQTFSAATVQNSDGQLIVHSDKFSFVNYSLEDGTRLSQKELTALVSQIPENEVLLKNAKGWRIAGYTLIGVAVVALGTNLVYTFADGLPAADTVRPVAGYATIGTSVLSLLALDLGSWNQMRAVDNYNIRIRVMGVPVN